jgi:hypothetical protein
VLDLFGELGRELALGLDCFQDRGLALGELAEFGDAKLNFADLLFVESAGLVLAIAGDEGDRVAFIEQLERAFDVRRGQP